MSERLPTVVAQNVQVEYRIYQSQRPTLRRLVAGGFRSREFRAIRAVDDVSFTVHQGEAVGLIGRNGSGKSSLLRSLAGLLPVTSGTVWASSTPVLLGIRAALQAELSGRDNIELGGTALGLTRAEVEERFADIVAFAELEDFIDVPLRAYSSGMVARLQLAIATCVRTEILLVDEALAVGDAAFRAKSEQRLRGIIADAGTVFLVSHALGPVRDLCDRVIWVDKGQVMGDGDPDEVIAAYQAFIKSIRKAR